MVRVLGLDLSPNMIRSATERYSSATTEFRVVDCRFLHRDGGDDIAGSFDKVISNAALHWILRCPETRIQTLKAIRAALRPGGAFAFEMGGHGNIPEMHTAFIAVLVRRGVSLVDAQDAAPWFFPSEAWMRHTLTGIGFDVQTLETEYRPTKLKANSDDPTAGLAGWARLMGACFLDVLSPDPDIREDIVQEVCALVKPVVTRIEDGTVWLGYVRLRGIAVRKSG